jgi:tetratricopeptide (TPR) repeat protein
MTERAIPEALLLTDERDFLLRSLEDLNVEHAAGDLSDDDLETMRAEYHGRLADVQRRIEGDQDQARKDGELQLRLARSKRRTKVFMLASLVFAVGTGFLIAGSLGERKAGETITGNTPQDPRTEKITELMARAQELSSTDPLGSIEAYDQVTKLNPEVVSAWAYGGWQLRLYAQGAEGEQRDALLAAAKRRVDEAISRDPTYADAQAFRAVMAARDFGDDQTAKTALKTLETLDRNPLIDQLTGPLRADLGLAPVTP